MYYPNTKPSVNNFQINSLYDVHEKIQYVCIQTNLMTHYVQNQ